MLALNIILSIFSEASYLIKTSNKNNIILKEKKLKSTQV